MRAHIRAVPRLTRHELACDVGHPAWYDFRTLEPFSLITHQAQMPAKLFDDFQPGRFPHWLLHEISFAVTS
jgi:hypothetical protein